MISEEEVETVPKKSKKEKKQKKESTEKRKQESKHEVGGTKRQKLGSQEPPLIKPSVKDRLRSVANQPIESVCILVYYIIFEFINSCEKLKYS